MKMSAFFFLKAVTDTTFGIPNELRYNNYYVTQADLFLFVICVQIHY